MNVLVIGTGYVGLTTAVAFAHLGHQVVCNDNNAALVELLQDGKVPIYEPGLDVLLSLVSNRIRFVSSIGPEDVNADCIFICVGTPSSPSGGTDVKYLLEAAGAIGETLPDGADVLVVNKSTVPVGSLERVEKSIEKALAARGMKAKVMAASNPEFLREGSALGDTFCPDRIVVGALEEAAGARLKQLYQPILDQTFEVVPGVIVPNSGRKPAFTVMKPASAELAKYAANTFLAMKISFANEIGGISDRVGADVMEVMHAVGLDDRIGPKFLGAGIGWGGSCFGKDIKGLVALGEQHGYSMPLAEATVLVNERQRRTVVDKLSQALGVLSDSTVAIWGLSFKPNTNDLRDAPAIHAIHQLLDLGANVRVYDPVAMPCSVESYPNLNIAYASSPLDAATGSDALVLVTEWEVFKSVDWTKVYEVMRNHVVVDGRNIWDGHTLRRLGFTYFGIGR